MIKDQNSSTDKFRTEFRGEILQIALAEEGIRKVRDFEEGGRTGRVEETVLAREIGQEEQLQ